MSLLGPFVGRAPGRLGAFAVLALGVLLLVQAATSPSARAGGLPEPGDPQSIIVGNQLSITTDRPWYFAGDYATICYRVPAPGYIEITDHQGGSVKTLLAGYDDGRGDCFGGHVTPPFGQECLRIRYRFPQGGSISTQTCFQVYLHF